MDRPSIGLVTCVHPLYDLPAIAAWREKAAAALRNAGCEVVLTAAPRTPADAAGIAARLIGAGVDLAVLFFCSWVAEELPLAVAQGVEDTPLLLWALPYLDRDIPMPSPITGLTASGANLRRAGRRFAHLVGAVDSPTVNQVARASRVAAAARAMRRTRLGVFGDSCPGMLDVATDESALQQSLGVATVHFTLEELLRAAEAVPVGEAEEAAGRLRSAARGNGEIGDSALAENLRLYVALRRLAQENRLDAYCVRCWPELRNQLPLTACAAHALMAEEGVPNTCEVDVTALLTTWLLSRLAGAPAFNFDITGYLEVEGAIQLAHCGAAAPSLAADPAQVRLRRHMRTGTGSTVEFPFPPGQVTIAKLMRPAGGRMGLFSARGEAIAAGEAVRGSVAMVRPEPSASRFLSAMLRLGVEHHLALAYGDWTGELQWFGDFTGVECLSPDRAVC